MDGQRNHLLEGDSDDSSDCFSDMPRIVCIIILTFEIILEDGVTAIQTFVCAIFCSMEILLMTKLVYANHVPTNQSSLFIIT